MEKKLTKEMNKKWEITEEWMEYDDKGNLIYEKIKEMD